MGYSPHGHVDFDRKEKVVIVESDVGEKAIEQVGESPRVSIERVTE